MLDKIFSDLKQEIKFGYLKKKHPFRYPVLASSADGFPHQRTVVLRDTTDKFEPLIYTDERSDKINHFESNPKASLLFYHPKKLLQVKITGTMEIIRDGEEFEQSWNKIQGNSRKDFTTIEAPGTPIKNPDNVEYSEEEDHFCVLKLVPSQMEYLQLKRPNHIRALFEKENDWEGEFLNP